MITENENVVDIDFGMTVKFDGKKNTVLCCGIVKDYPIGGMMCEYARLHPTDIKKVIMESSDFNTPYDLEKVITALKDLTNALIQNFDAVTALMIATDMLSLITDYIKASDTEKKEMLGDGKKKETSDKIAEFILKDTGLSCFGMDTVGQLLLTGYYLYSASFVGFKYLFDAYVTELEVEAEQATFFWELYGGYMNMQHIDFRIAYIDGEFASLYTIKSSLSLLLFEIAHSIDAETQFVKCQNCNQYFVPEGRSDAVYCSYPSPQNIKKTCKEIGAQVARANKEKSDITTKEYRKVYMRYMMHMTRHPSDNERAAKLEQLTSEVKEWRNKLAHGIVTEEEFLDWLGQF